MKRTFLLISSLLIFALAGAQTTENYLARYNAIVSRLGFDGIGVETLIQKWEKADPEDINHMIAKFNFYLAKSMKDSLVVSSKRNYMDLTPVLELKDSTGAKRYYFNEKVFDNQNFGKAMAAMDNAITHNNARLDLALLKIETLIAYEKTIPDTSVDEILSLMTRHYTGKSKWDYPGETVDDKFFAERIQEFCLSYYNIGSDQSYEAFRTISERALKLKAKQVCFTDNLGAYYVTVKKDDKKALKYYTAAIKADPEDIVAKQNITLINRRAANSKKK